MGGSGVEGEEQRRVSKLLAFTFRMFLIMWCRVYNIMSFHYFLSKTYLTLLLKGSIRNLETL